jgi:hypothetical protein
MIPSFSGVEVNSRARGHEIKRGKRCYNGGAMHLPRMKVREHLTSVVTQQNRLNFFSVPSLD